MKKDFINFSSAKFSVGSFGFSPAVRTDNIVFISGCGSLDPDSEEIKILHGTIEEETVRTLDYIKDLVTQAGGSLSDIVKCNCFLADLDDFPVFTKVFAEYFKDVPVKPARATVGVNLLSGIKVEIEAIAVLNN